jgi:hypothetical protein
MLERPCEVAHLRVVEEEVGTDAVDFTTEGVKGISNARTSRGCPCLVGERPFTPVFSLATWTLLWMFPSAWAHVGDVWSDVPCPFMQMSGLM